MGWEELRATINGIDLMLAILLVIAVGFALDQRWQRRRAEARWAVAPTAQLQVVSGLRNVLAPLVREATEGLPGFEGFTPEKVVLDVADDLARGGRDLDLEWRR